MVALGCLEGRGRLCKGMMFTEFPGSPVAKTLRFHCRGPQVPSLVGGGIPAHHAVWLKLKLK